MRTHNYKSGMTLVEVIVTFGIISVVFLVVISFFVDSFTLNRNISDRLTVAGDARRALKTITAEARSASPSSIGGYPLAETATSTFTFYSDIDNDPEKERIRYFLSGNKLMRGVIHPTGNPYVYDISNEVITQLASHVVNTSAQPIFSYYDSTYSGTQPPLSGAFSISVVRLVKIELRVDGSGTTTANTQIFTTQVSMRNLKDNL